MLNIIILGIIFILVDSLYLTSSSSHFNKLIHSIQGSPLHLKPIPTVLCYLSLVASLYVFIIREKRTPFYAGLLGFFIYSVFELTNMAIFKNWSWFTVLLDTTWGFILYYLVTYLYYFIKNYI
jgi:uncharacterized membrane protein